MLVIKKICDYTIPIFGNKRVLPMQSYLFLMVLQKS